MPYVSKIEVSDNCAIYIWRVVEDTTQLLSLCEVAGVAISAEDRGRPANRLCEILATRLLLFNIFGGDVSLAHRECGAPYIEDEDCAISISHTKGAVVVAISKSDIIGVDIEYMNERVIRIKDKFLNDAEKSFIAADDTVGTLVAWTAKEAIFKAVPECGIDFRGNLLLSKFSDSDLGIIRFDAKFVKGEISIDYSLTTYRYEDFMVTLAVES